MNLAHYRREQTPSFSGDPVHVFSQATAASRVAAGQAGGGDPALCAAFANAEPFSAVNPFFVRQAPNHRQAAEDFTREISPSHSVSLSLFGIASRGAS